MKNEQIDEGSSFIAYQSLKSTKAGQQADSLRGVLD